MSQARNHLGQPVGDPVPDWTPPGHSPREAMEGRFCRLEPLDAGTHAEALHAANELDKDGRSWTYLPYGPFESFEAYHAWISSASKTSDPLFFAICRKTDGVPVGVASYLRIDPAKGSIEVGHLHFSEQMKQSPIATEAMYLMMQKAFELGYRRYEWKCDALNAASRAAAQRLGLSYEGVFRQAAVYKGRSRDTAWYATIDAEWPELEQAFMRWLDPENFDEEGRQRIRLSDLTKTVLKHSG